MKTEEAEDKDRKCPFFRIPGELRNAIYDLALTADNGVVVIDPRHKALQSVFALEATCKQIRKECRNMAYELNDVQVDLGFLTRFMTGLSPTEVESANSTALRCLRSILSVQEARSPGKKIVLDLGTLARHHIIFSLRDVLKETGAIAFKLRSAGVQNIQVTFSHRVSTSSIFETLYEPVQLEFSLEGEAQQMVATINQPQISFMQAIQSNTGRSCAQQIEELIKTLIVRPFAVRLDAAEKLEAWMMEFANADGI